MTRKSGSTSAQRKIPKRVCPPVRLDPKEQQATLAKLFREQGTKPVADFHHFLDQIHDAWPEQENVNEFIAAYRAARRP